jgi:hypothetical protein
VAYRDLKSLLVSGQPDSTDIQRRPKPCQSLWARGRPAIALAYANGVVQEPRSGSLRVSVAFLRPRVHIVRCARPCHVPFPCSYFNLVLHPVFRQEFEELASFPIENPTMTGNDTDLDLIPEDSPKAYKVGTIRDQHDMRRVGKTQELRVGGNCWVFIF